MKDDRLPIKIKQSDYEEYLNKRARFNKIFMAFFIGFIPLVFGTFLLNHGGSISNIIRKLPLVIMLILFILPTIACIILLLSLIIKPKSNKANGVEQFYTSASMIDVIYIHYIYYTHAGNEMKHHEVLKAYDSLNNTYRVKCEIPEKIYENKNPTYPLKCKAFVINNTVLISDIVEVMDDYPAEEYHDKLRKGELRVTM